MSIVAVTTMTVMVTALIGPSANPKPVQQAYIDQIESTVQKMEARWRTLDEACDTNAPFSLIYLYMTRELKSHVQRQYFDDNDLMSNFTRAFAKRYEDAIDAWMASSVNAVGITDPWMTAFRYGYSNKSSVLEDLFLGMNAHINYDLALIVSGLQYGKAENKKDYDRINDILTAMMPVVSDDIAGRYYRFMNSTLVDIFSPAGLVVLFGWRQNAWNNGVLIQNALTDIDRGLLMTNLKTQAMLGTVPYMTYNLGFPTNVARKAFCQDHHH